MMNLLLFEATVLFFFFQSHKTHCFQPLSLFQIRPRENRGWDPWGQTCAHRKQQRQESIDNHDIVACGFQGNSTLLSLKAVFHHTNSPCGHHGPHVKSDRDYRPEKDEKVFFFLKRHLDIWFEGIRSYMLLSLPFIKKIYKNGIGLKLINKNMPWKKLTHGGRWSWRDLAGSSPETRPSHAWQKTENGLLFQIKYCWDGVCFWTAFIPELDSWTALRDLQIWQSLPLHKLPHNTYLLKNTFTLVSVYFWGNQWLFFFFFYSF